MLIPKVLKEGQDPSRTAKGKVTVIAYHDSALIAALDTPDPVTCISVPDMWWQLSQEKIQISQASQITKSSVSPVFKISPHLSMFASFGHVLSSLHHTYSTVFLPAPSHTSHSSPPFLSSYCSKTTLCCHHQILHSHSIVSGSSLHLIPSRQVSSPIHLSSRCLQALLLFCLQTD